MKVKQARELLGERKSMTDRVFKGLKYRAVYNTEIIRWCNRAGVFEHITFHSARHTNAVLLLENGADIYIVSKRLLNIPASITSIEKGAFLGSGLISVTLEATTPPQIENYIGLFFDKYDENQYGSTPKLTNIKTIYVPASSLSAYQNAEGWKGLAAEGISILPKS